MCLLSCYLSQPLGPEENDDFAKTILAPSAEQGKAIAALKELGAIVKTQDKALGQPLVSVSLAKVTEPHIVQLRVLTALLPIRLQLWEWEITDADVKLLSRLTDLQSLELVHTRVTDVGLSYLRGLTRLRELELFVCYSITDAGMRQVSELRNLEVLSLTYNHVTDAGLKQLKGLTKLRELDLTATKISDPELEHLQGLSRLEILALPVNEKISNNCFQYLKAFSHLRRIILDRTEVTEEGIAAFRKDRPSVFIPKLPKW